jgi:hypothetical protein
MSMSDPNPQMKPQDTVIFLLGQLDGKMGAVQASIAVSAQSQAEHATESHREHDEFRSDIASIKAAQPVRVSPWAKVGVVLAIPSSLIALVGFIVLYFQPH